MTLQQSKRLGDPHVFLSRIPYIQNIHKQIAQSVLQVVYIFHLFQGAFLWIQLSGVPLTVSVSDLHPQVLSSRRKPPICFVLLVLVTTHKVLLITAWEFLKVDTQHIVLLCCCSV